MPRGISLHIGVNRHSGRGGQVVADRNRDEPDRSDETARPDFGPQKPVPVG